MRATFGYILVSGVLMLWFGAGISDAQFNRVIRVSGGSGLAQANAASSSISISDDGELAVFASLAGNLVNGDDNELADVFLYDRGDISVTRISTRLGGGSPNGASSEPTISADGQVIAFTSAASNLVNGDLNQSSNVFVFDRGSGSLTRVSRSSGGQEGQGASGSAALSSDGAIVAFASRAENLVNGDNNGEADIFVHIRGTGATTRVSIGSGGNDSDGGSSEPAISGDGSVVAFVSSASNLVANDINGFADVFVHDRNTGITTLVSARSGGVGANAASSGVRLSADGRYVVFESAASNLVDNDLNGLGDVFLYDRTTSSLARVSLDAAGGDANGASAAPDVSDDGRYVAFISGADDLIGLDTNEADDVFIADMQAATDRAVRASVTKYGRQLSGSSSAPSMSGDAVFVAFLSDADDLVSGDTNEVADAFVVASECLLGLAASLNTDGDTVLDCAEVCGDDASKTDQGTCGCGVPDTDTDADSSADCVDACPTDASKFSSGVCGCGISDADANGNGVSDCLDPDSSTQPRKAVVTLGRQGRARVLKLEFPDAFSGVTYAYNLRRGGKLIKSAQSRRQTVRLRNLPAGVYTFTYTVSLGGITTRSSPRQTIRIR